MRRWQGRKNDDGAVHCIGNGLMCVYEQGPDVIQLFGPAYSSPSVLNILLEDESLTAETHRMPGTAIYKHVMAADDGATNEITDFVDALLPCFVRSMDTSVPMKLCINLIEDFYITDNSEHYTEIGFTAGLLIGFPAGRYIYNDYPMPRKIFLQLLFKGDISVKIRDKSIAVTVGQGKHELYVIGGEDYRECRLFSEEVCKTGYRDLFDRTNLNWKVFSGRKHNIASSLREDAPLRSEFLNALDSVSVLIKAQQGQEGGVLAGHNYHLAYVRDQYGVFRCLLKLGYYEEAKRILLFYWNIWKKFGRICNAQGIGVPGLFHEHENDEVEITGYLILQSFDYLEATGDRDILIETLPMLEWAFDAQKKHLVSGMLPFNGDETYVAGSILPRSALNDGSAEATMLFIEGGRRLLNWLEINWLSVGEKIELRRKVLEEAENKYKHNFLREGSLIANNPERKKFAAIPLFRHGVCEGCFQSSNANRIYSFGWTEKNKHGRYLCPNCISNSNIGPAEDIAYHIHSAALMPLYIKSSLFTNQEIAEMLRPVIKLYKDTGKLPSRPDGSITVGYDYGLLLYSLTEIKHPLAEEIYRRMFSVIDAAGAWVEYYENDKPKGTRCRPWESGINLEAAINYLQKTYSK
ncbi:MAG TPA: hypothetical protein GX505_11935 [Clostridiales bacterium]|nr:hypothetical protein [Clostridiales bacterium]